MINLKATLTRVKEIGDKDPEKIQFTPYRDWSFIVSFSLLCIVAIGTLHFFIYTKIDEGSFSYDNTEIKNTGDLDIKKLHETVGVYTQKEEDFNRIYNNKELLVDPSL